MPGLQNWARLMRTPIHGLLEPDHALFSLETLQTVAALLSLLSAALRVDARIHSSSGPALPPEPAAATGGIEEKADAAPASDLSMFSRILEPFAAEELTKRAWGLLRLLGRGFGDRSTNPGNRGAAPSAWSMLTPRTTLEEEEAAQRNFPAPLVSSRIMSK